MVPPMSTSAVADRKHTAFAMNTELYEAWFVLAPEKRSVGGFR
jgi:hypothetical protein